MGEENKNQKREKSTAAVMLVEVLSLAAGMILLMLMNKGSIEHFFTQYVDMPTLLLLLVLSVPAFIYSGLWKDFVRAFSVKHSETHWKLSEWKRTLEAVELLQRQIVFSGMFVALAQLVLLLHNMTDLASLGPWISCMLLAGVYVAVFELLLMPLSVEVKKKIIDYMDTEEE